MKEKIKLFKKESENKYSLYGYHIFLIKIRNFDFDIF